MADSSGRRQRIPIAEEDEVVGLHEETEMILNRLLNDEPELQVIPIVGMGGIGKTTLARKIYHHPLVVKYFDFQAWVYVSAEYKVLEILLTIMKYFNVFIDEIKDMSQEELMMTVRKHLRGRRYLIVLDDVWKTEFWDEFKHIFANDLQGSRILLTTRNMEVVFLSSPDGFHCYLSFLRDEESWDLLCKKVFRRASCPLDLEAVGHEIARKCRGLPLAIVVIAGVLMRKEKMVHRWMEVLDSLSSYLTDYTQFIDVLELSYIQLPYPLNWCFLYFAAFPEDFEIPTKQLIRLWIAEGFVKPKEGETVEEVAEEYLNDLISGNLIQAVKLRFDGSVKTCRIHDLLGDLCTSKAREEKIIEGHRNVHSLFQFSSRRLSIHSDALQFITSNSSTSNLRSFLCFGSLDEGQLSSRHWKLLYRRFPLLRVVDLGGVFVGSIPKEVEELILLRYLRLRSRTARSLPSSICNLLNLQILEVTAPSIDHPQIGIWKMQQLRHLNFQGQPVLLPDPRDHDNTLSNLQSLMRISPDSCTRHIISRVPELVKLGIYGDLSKLMDLKAFNSISVLKHLQKLKLEGDRRFQSLSSLDRVEIPASITKLTLSETLLSTDPMQKLGNLPNLQVLKLTNDAYVGEGLYCSSGGFPQLKVLEFINLRIEMWELSSGSMTSLQRVVIGGCDYLGGLPSALKDISTLQKLELWRPNSSVLRDSEDAQKTHIGNDRLQLTVHNSEN